jgi:mRNA interferase MazF
VTTNRGDIWLVDFGDPIGSEQSGRRPAVIISADRLNQSRAGVVIVIPCTTRRRGLPSHIELDPQTSELSEVSYAKCEDIKSISEQRLIAKLGSANDETLFDISKALTFLLGF